MRSVITSHMLARLGSLDLSSGRKRPACDLALEEEAGGHDDVVAGAAGEQLGLEHLVGVEDVVVDLDAGLLGEVLEDRLVDVVRPVVDVDDALLRRWRRRSAASDAAVSAKYGCDHVELLPAECRPAPALTGRSTGAKPIDILRVRQAHGVQLRR